MYKKLSLLTLVSSFAFAGTMGPVDTCPKSLYFKVGSGGSWSMNTNLYNDPRNLDHKNPKI